MIAKELDQIEKQLKKRLPYRYQWYRKQNDKWDKLTNFIYQIDSFEELLLRAEIEFEKLPKIDRQEFFNYVSNRWYNFNSARAVEKIFCNSPNVKAALNSKDRLKDFTINGISFDHKTSIFPNGFGKDLNYAKTHEKELISWLYDNQSSQSRRHLENRLFIVLFRNDGKHWKLKAEINWLKKIIAVYLENFRKENLNSLKLKQNNQATFADIIWAIKE